jgi:hypothetical protein
MKLPGVTSATRRFLPRRFQVLWPAQDQLLDDFAMDLSHELDASLPIEDLPNLSGAGVAPVFIESPSRSHGEIPFRCTDADQLGDEICAGLLLAGKP